MFPSATIQQFWMRNTTLPLSIAYADEHGRIVRIADLEPLDEHPVTSLGPARYALEMNRGWFAAHGVVAGDEITGIPDQVTLPEREVIAGFLETYESGESKTNNVGYAILYFMLGAMPLVVADPV